MSASSVAFRTLTILATSAAVLLAGAARAQSASTCTTDSQCVRGFTCQATPCPDSSSACPPGSTSCEPAPACYPATQPKQCYFAPCTSDADCGTDMVCYTATDTTCSTTPATGSSSGGYTGSSGCVTTSKRLCAPRYLLPCNTDSACGDGFTCKLSQTCSGSSAGGEVCTTGTTGRCKAPEIACTSDATCPSNWTCATVTTDNPSLCAVSVGVDGGVEPAQPTCPPPTTTTRSLCVPPYYEQVAALEGNDTLKGSPSGLPTRGQTSGGGSSGDSGGCQVALGGARSEGAALLGLVGILGLVRRRRARA